ncbi:MAG: glycosyltransferase family protein, partial [Anaerolineae bacterium]
TGSDERVVAQAALSEAAASVATDSAGTENAAAHVGTYLIGRGRGALETRINYSPDAAERIRRWTRRHASPLYLTSIAAVAAVIYVIAALLTTAANGSPWYRALPVTGLVVAILALIPPTLIAASSLVDRVVTSRSSPDRLPKLEFVDEIPLEHQTLVAVPAMIGSTDDIDNLVKQLEVHYLSNPQSGVFFALLSDYGDAASETRPEDESLLAYALRSVEALNARYPIESSADSPAAAAPRFYLLHRRRLWNPVQDRWMGWERKRGKLNELNRFLRGSADTTFFPICASEEVARALRPTRYVITLDADTILPPGAARRLIGTLAHPLNCAVFDGAGRVISGYTVLQPRMEVHPSSVGRSWFTRIYAGRNGLDLYTHAVSDTYQDLFGEGSYVGKGIYDVDAFERATHGRIPENRLLSHDLLEGILGRAGLVTDITMVEDHPPSYFSTSRRQHRWIRGDWQLLPWLLRPGRFNCSLSSVDRWKIIHNLLRSLVSPALIATLMATATMPGHPWLWLLAFFLAYGIPLVTSMPAELVTAMRGEAWKVDWTALGQRAARLLLAVVFLPYGTYVATQAIQVTLYRLLISHRYLLTWTTAAQAARHAQIQLKRDLRIMLTSAAVATVLMFCAELPAILQRQVTLGRSLLETLPLVLLWLSGPLLVRGLDRRIVERQEAPSEEDLAHLRRIGRRTWNYFLHFVGPQDHWLPPDHFQEAPIEIVAHHTSPSNIGLYLTSILAAYDLGYVHQLGLAARFSATMEALPGLTRYRGHLLNWYNTETLAPLPPRYVSTVDSGNLAASLIVVARAARQMGQYPVLRWHAWQGYLDTLSELLEVIRPGSDPQDPQVRNIHERVEAMRQAISAAETDPMRWYALCDIACGDFWPRFTEDLADLIGSRALTLNREGLRRLQEIAGQATWHHDAVQVTLNEMVPWVFYLQDPPRLFLQPPYADTLAQMEHVLVHNPLLGQIGDLIEASRVLVATLRGQMDQAPATSQEADSLAMRDAREWLTGLAPALEKAVSRAAWLS